MRKIGKKLIALVLTFLMVFCVFAIVGCSGGTEDESPDGTKVTELSDESYAELTGIIETAQKQPEFTAPGDPYDINAAVAGKTILTIPMSTGNPFPTGISKCLADLGKKLGVTVKIWENQGEVSEWVQGVESAANLGANVVDLSAGSNPNNLGAQIEVLQNQGIYVQSSHFSDVSQKVDYVDANCGAPYANGGKLLADWAILKGGADVHIVIITSNEVPSAEAMVNAIETEFKKYAPDATRTYINVPCNEWASKIQTEVLTAVQKDKDLDYVAAIYDPMTQYIVPALEMANAQDNVKVIGFNGTPFVIDYVREGKVEMTIGENLDWVAHAAMDTAGRLLAGEPIPKDTMIPLYIWTAENAESAGIPAEYNAGYGDVYIEGYNKMWMIK